MPRSLHCILYNSCRLTSASNTNVVSVAHRTRDSSSCDISWFSSSDPGVTPATSTLRSAYAFNLLVSVSVCSNEGFNPFNQKAAVKPLLIITPEGAKNATVTLFNIYAGRNILHGINKVLLPDMERSAAPAAVAGSSKNKITAESANAVASAPPATAKPTTPSSSGSKVSSAGRRHLLLAGSQRQLQQIGGIGLYQTWANGVTGNNTLEAIANAATSTIPLQYTTRFGSLEVAAAVSGCLNCVGWGS